MTTEEYEEMKSDLKIIDNQLRFANKTFFTKLQHSDYHSLLLTSIMLKKDIKNYLLEQEIKLLKEHN